MNAQKKQEAKIGPRKRIIFDETYRFFLPAKWAQETAERIQAHYAGEQKSVTVTQCVPPMPMDDLAFSRADLKAVLVFVKAAGITDPKEAYVMKAGVRKGQWEFHYHKYYDGCLRADNAYDARAKGWRGYLRSIGKDADI